MRSNGIDKAGVGGSQSWPMKGLGPGIKVQQPSLPTRVDDVLQRSVQLNRRGDSSEGRANIYVSGKPHPHPSPSCRETLYHKAFGTVMEARDHMQALLA